MSEAQRTTASLSGKWHGHYGVAPCPVCQREGRRDQNALTLTDGASGQLLMHCKKTCCDFRDIAAALGLNTRTTCFRDAATVILRNSEYREKAVCNSRHAEAIWNEALPIEGSIAECYLRHRGIGGNLSAKLRFHPACWHFAAPVPLPAMIAKIDGSKRFAIHRTWLRDDGHAKAGVDPVKAMLGSVSGGAVRLTEGHVTLAVAEGIETALSLSCGLLQGSFATWAALSTSGLVGLRLPPKPGRLIIATDGDTAGSTAGHKLAERAAGLGWAVSILPAPDGQDWNDVLQFSGEASK